MMVPDSKIVFRMCECGTEVFIEPCSSCGKDDSQGMEQLQDDLMGDQGAAMERELIQNFNRHQRRAEEKKVRTQMKRMR